MAEWTIAAVLKTAVPQGTGGSNPSLSAIFFVPAEFPNNDNAKTWVILVRNLADPQH